MLRNRFDSEIEINSYIEEQKIRMKKGFLTKSERDHLKRVIENPKVYIIQTKPRPNVKPIITNLQELKKPCERVLENEDISQIILELKDTCIANNGWGLSANQIGYNKQISYLHFPYMNKETKKPEFFEKVLINAEIIEKDRKITVRDEMCLSFPNLRIITDRYVFVIVRYLDEKFKEQLLTMQDTEGIVIQHEIDHQHSRTIFDVKHKGE